jgi:FkbM family methyltransferase
MIKKLFETEELRQSPPVLIDIGASGEIHAKWKDIAEYSICLAFDADDREMSFEETKNSKFKKLITINRIVSSTSESETDFYLTSSPFCSSTLKPDSERLSHWPFDDLFTVDKSIKLKCVMLAEALDNAKIDYVDWIKIDTQGTDLRLFKTLPEAISKRILAAEFEPGILDAYLNEDKLFQVLGFMDKSQFFISSLEIKGVPRIKKVTAEKFGLRTRSFYRSQRFSPGWGEICYLNTLSQSANKRDYFLTYVFSLIEGQNGFALDIAEAGSEKFGDRVFSEMRDYAIKKIKRKQLYWPIFAAKNRLNRVLERFLF